MYEYEKKQKIRVLREREDLTAFTFELAFGFFVFDEGGLRRSWCGVGGGLGNGVVWGSSERRRTKEVFLYWSDGLGDEFFGRELRVRLRVRVDWFWRRWRDQRELGFLHYGFFCGGDVAGSGLVHGGTSRLRRTRSLNCVVVVVCLFVFFFLLVV